MTRGIPKKWTSDEANEARAMWAKGTSATKVGAHFGITRNAAIGRLHRMGATTPVCQGLHGFDTPAKSRKRPAFVIQNSEPTKPRELPPEEPSTELAVTTANLAPGQCKWPLNDGAPRWLHCGAHTDDGPYCPFHARKAIGGAPRKDVAA